MKSNVKITIYKLSYVMNDNGEWDRCMIKWKDIWADVSQSFIKGNVPYFRFVARWQQDFPNKIAVFLNGNFLKITAPPVTSPNRSYITFSGILTTQFSTKDIQNASI